MFDRRSIAITLAMCACAVGAQPYPNKPIRIVMPFAPGGPMELVSRPYAQRLSEALKNPVVIDSRPGANGAIGAEHVARSPADGYTLVIGAGGSFAVYPNVYDKLPFDVARDFVGVSMLATMTELLAVHPQLPVKSVKELVALAKARPNQLVFGSSGTGGMPHMSMELLKQATGIDMTHVPYKGAGPATVDLMGGQIQLVFLDIPVLLPQVRSGRLRALAVGAKTRVSALPAVPTVAEQGWPDFEANNWYGVFAPAALPREILSRLSVESLRFLASAEFKATMAAQGAEVALMNPAEMATFFRNELARWGQVVKVSGVKLD